MQQLLASTVLAGALFGGVAAANAAECGNVTIASMNWQSAEVLSNLDKIILEEGYGCSAEIIVGDTVPTFTSMAEKGQPDIAPEAWIDTLPEVVERGVSEGKVVMLGKPLPDGGQQGWWIPKYIADAHPDIKTVADALKHPELFPAPEDSSKGAVYNGPQGWSGTLATTQLYRAFDADKDGFTLVDTGSAAGLDGSVARAYERKVGWMGYYWSPTSLLGKYDMVRLQVGQPNDAAEWKRCNTVAECPDPKPIDWPVDRVVTLVAKSFSERVDPSVLDYLGKRSWSNETVNDLMAWMTENQAPGEDAAKHFLETNGSVWEKWVTPEAAAKIKAGL